MESNYYNAIQVLLCLWVCACENFMSIWGTLLKVFDKKLGLISIWETCCKRYHDYTLIRFYVLKLGIILKNKELDNALIISLNCGWINLFL